MSELLQPRARILDVSEAEYRDDPCAVPSLSQSIAKVMLEESPRHAWKDHPRLGPALNPGFIKKKESKAMDNGDVIHALLLGKGADVEIIHGFDNWKKKAAQALRDEAKAAGKLPMLVHQYESLEDAASYLHESLKSEFGIDLTEEGGESEVAIEWEEDGIHGPVLCRGRMDRLQLNRGKIYDVKTIYSAHPDVVGKQMTEMGRDIQHAAYVSAVERLRPELAGRISMEFLHLEIEPPYAIYPGPPDGELRELGRVRWNRAVVLWEDCLRRNRWPAYVDKITPIRGHGWSLKTWMEKAQEW